MTLQRNLITTMESTLIHSERVQISIATELLKKAVSEKRASHGLLLNSVESETDFPMITLYTAQNLRTDGNANDYMETLRKNAIDMFKPSNSNYFGDHLVQMCREIATISKPHTTYQLQSYRSNNASTGYIVSIFRVFEGDDKEKLERNWLYWTGARLLYYYLPKSVALRRITLHKSVAARGDKLYLLLCECSNLLDNVNYAAQLLPALRARLCGYIGIYRVASAF